MSIELMCPLCGAVNAFTPDQAGSLGQCGQCHTPLYVPRPEEMPAPASIKRFGRPSRGAMMSLVLTAAVVVLVGVGLVAGGYFAFFRKPTEVLGQQRPQDPFALAQKVKLTVADSVTQDGVIDQSNGETIYKISAPAAGVVIAALDRVDDSKLDAMLIGYNDKHKEIAQNDADADKRVSQLILPVKADQDYFVKVGGCDATTGKYKVIFKHLEKPSGGFDGAHEVRLSKAGLAAQSWRIERDGEEHYFRLSSPQAGWAFVEIGNALGGNLDGMLTAYDDARRRVSDSTRSVRFYMTQGKNYYVKAGSMANPATGLARTGNYTLTFRLVKTAADDHGNDFASATKVPLDLLGSATMQGQIETDLDVDYFVLQATKTGNVNLKVSYPFGSQLDAFTLTFDGTGNPYGLGNSLFVETGKTYYVKVTPYGFPLAGRQKTGAYTLNLSMNAGFGQNTGVPKQIFLNNFDGGGAASGQLFNADDVVWFSFNATKTGKINIKVNYPFGSQLDAALFGYDGNRSQQLGVGNGTSWVDFNVTAGVTYHVKVASQAVPAAFRQRTGAFDLNFYMNAPSGKTKTPKDAFATAQEIFLDGGGRADLDGRINGASDARYYRFKAQRTGWMIVSATAPFGSQLGAEVNSFNDAKISVVPVGLATIYFPVTAGKNYYLKVNSMLAPPKGKESTGDYKLGLSNPETLKDDYGNDFATAATITKANNLGLTGSHGQIETPQDVDCFRFTADANGKLTISVFSGQAGLQSHLAVYDGNQKLLGEQARTPQLHPSISIDAEAGRTYYVKVSAQQGEQILAEEKVGSYFLMLLAPLPKAPAKTGKGATKVNAADLAGAKWVGQNYEKMDMTIVFDAKGTFSTSYGGATYNDGNWKLEGDNKIYMECNNKFCEYRGVIDSDVMNLDTWNSAGLRWKTRLERTTTK
jgi:Bacterial pre-peptidase C-terminal domain